MYLSVMHNSQMMYTTLRTHSKIAKYKVKLSIHHILFLHSRLPDRPAVGGAGEGPAALRNVPEIVLPIVLYIQVRIIMKQSVRIRYLACMYFKLIYNHILYAICTQHLYHTSSLLICVRSSRSYTLSAHTGNEAARLPSTIA